MQFIHKLVSTFGIGLEQSGLSSTGNVGGALTHGTLAKRAQVAAQDPAFQRLKAQFQLPWSKEATWSDVQVEEVDKDTGTEDKTFYGSSLTLYGSNTTLYGSILTL